jgi:ligand-binding sensor domain-containing protein
MWVGTSKGIVEIDSNNNWILHGETEDILPLSMTVDQTGALWIGAHDPFNFRGSIKKFHNGVWKSYALDQMGYESAFPYAIAVDKDNAVVAVLAGTATRAVIKFTNLIWTELALPQNARGMRAMAIEQNTIWTGGVEFMRLNNISSSTVANPAASSTILSLGIDAHGYKWLGTISNGLMVYHE